MSVVNKDKETPERLKDLEEWFFYRDGKVYWKKDKCKSKRGDEAGNFNKRGYREINLNKVTTLTHRVVWALNYGEFPDGVIDHIDQNSLNNNVDNLRVVPQKVNAENSKLSSNNTSGVKGVGVYKKTGKYYARIDAAGVKPFLGYFDTFEEACFHRLAAEQCLNWGDGGADSSASLYCKEVLNGPVD